MSCLLWFFVFRGFTPTARIYRPFGAENQKHDTRLSDYPVEEDFEKGKLYPIQACIALNEVHGEVDMERDFANSCKRLAVHRLLMSARLMNQGSKATRRVFAA